MKKILFSSFLVFIFLHTSAQTPPKELEGAWLGTLDVGVKLRIVFHFSMQNDTITATMDSPDQGAFDIPTDRTIFAGNQVDIARTKLNATYSGKYIADSALIRGVFIQAGSKVPLLLSKTDHVDEIKRPQTPKKPYPYQEEKITFANKNADSVTLAGTLTIPEGKGPFHAVVLVTGSGAQDRDEALLGHHPFWVLSDYLTRKGIIVLRYDDRGFAESTGDYSTATSVDFASDANAAVAYLKGRKDMHIDKIGIAGHSEGGLIAPLAASTDSDVDYLVLIAGTGINGEELLQLQLEKILRAAGTNDTVVIKYKQFQKEMIGDVKNNTSMEDIRNALLQTQKNWIKNSSEALLDAMGMDRSDTSASANIAFMANPWMKYFLTYDPRPVLEKTKIPVLAINGTHDLQVPYQENLGEIDKALKKAGNTEYKIVQLEGLNHLFQHSDSGLPSEYATIEETFAPEALQIIADWILALK